MRKKCNKRILIKDLKICRMKEFDWGKCSDSLMSSKLILGQIATVDGIKKAGNMSNDVVKFCSYFTEKKLIGFLSANPGSYSVQDVAEFLNNAKVVDGCIKSSVKGTAISLGLKEFADIFELPYEGDADVDIDEELLIPMYLANKAEGKEVAFRYSMLRKNFNHSYSILAHIFLSIVDGRVGGFDQLTKARMSMMYHVYKDLPFNWGRYIFGRLVEEVKAFQLKKIDGLYGPVKRIGFGLRILCILKHFNVAFSEHKTLGKGRFFGEKCTFGVPKIEGRNKAKRKPVRKMKTHVQKSKKVGPVKRSGRLENVVAEVEKESEDVSSYDEMMNVNRNLASKRKTHVQQSEKFVPVKRIRRLEKVLAEVEEEAEDVSSHGEMMNNNDSNDKKLEVNVHHETEMARSNSDPTPPADSADSYNFMDSCVPLKVKIPNPVLNFTDIEKFEDFKIYADGELLDTKIPPHYRMKYYELCNSQKSFLHEHVKGCGGLVAGIIEQTITIAEDAKAANISTSIQDLKNMENTLKSFEDLGMNVGFLRGRIIKLGKLLSEHQTLTEFKKAKLSQMVHERTALNEEKLELNKLKKKVEELTKSVKVRESSLLHSGADVDALIKKSKELGLVIKETVGSAW